MSMEIDSVMSAPNMYCPRDKRVTESEPYSHTYFKARSGATCEKTRCLLCGLKRCRCTKKHGANRNPAKFRSARYIVAMKAACVEKEW